MNKKRLAEEVLEEDPETRFYMKKDIMKDKVMERKDSLDSFYMKAKIYVFWILMIIPFRLFNVFFFLIIYCLWYQIFVRFFSKIPIVNRASHCLDTWIRRYFAPFFSWYMSCIYGFYYPKLIVVEKDVFEMVCKKYQGKPGKPEKKSPYLAIANHSSYCDTFTMFRHYGERGVVAKKNLKHDAILGPLMREIGCVFTDKKNIVKKLISKSDKYYNDPNSVKKLMIFPEGTTTNGKYLLKFHRGAFIPGRPLDIAYIRYDYKYFDPSWANVKSAIQYFETLNSQFYQDYYLIKFPVYNPNEDEKKDSALFARNVRRTMCDIANYYTAEKLGKIELCNIKFVRHLKKK